jgi:hypothetical protein
MEFIVMFKPLLLEMEMYDESLDREEFVESAIALLQGLTIHDRNLVLNFGK